MENKKLERAQVHRLPTKDVTEIVYNPIRLDTPMLLKGNEHKLISGEKPLYIHLCFTTDEQPEKGDWTILGDEVVQVVNSTKDDRKIIATTDPKLTEYCKGVHKLGEGCNHNKTCNFPDCRVAQPSQATIKAYCEQGGFDEVDVEYIEEWFLTNGKPIPDVMRKSMEEKLPKDSLAKWNIVRTLKVDPIHNTITTHRIVEKMWNKEEVEALVDKAHTFGMYHEGNKYDTSDIPGVYTKCTDEDFLDNHHSLDTFKQKHL